MSKARGKLVQSHNKVVQKYLVNPRSWLVTLIRAGHTCPVSLWVPVFSTESLSDAAGSASTKVHKPLIGDTRCSGTRASVLITKLRNYCIFTVSAVEH
jgi:hypothetical protein